jgi:hypothetical protein
MFQYSLKEKAPCTIRNLANSFSKCHMLLQNHVVSASDLLNKSCQRWCRLTKISETSCNGSRLYFVKGIVFPQINPSNEIVWNLILSSGSMIFFIYGEYSSYNLRTESNYTADKPKCLF